MEGRTAPTSSERMGSNGRAEDTLTNRNGAAPSEAAGRSNPTDWRSSRALAAVETAVVVLLALGVVLRLAADIKLGVGSLWWGERLAFAEGLLRGFDLYPGAHSGVITGDVYGLVLAPFYVPAALFSSVTAKMVAGQVSSVLVMLAPLGVLVQRSLGARHGALAPWAAGMALLAGLLAWFPATNYQLTAIAADAPCLGFGMGSFVVLTGARPPSIRRLAVAAALVALATLTKPNAVSMALALVVVAAYRGGLVRGLAFAGLYALLTAALGLLLVRATGTTLAGVWYNDVVIPSSQMPGHTLRSFVRGMGKLTLPMFALLAATLLPLVVPRAGERQRRVDGPVIELWFVAAALIPVSYLGRAKIGGDVNSFHAHYFAIAGTAVALIHTFSNPRYRPLRVAAFGALALFVMPFGSGNPFSNWSDNTHERVFAYLKSHEDAYFPWHSLATLAATGHYFHNSDGVYSRSLAARAPTREEFLRNAPRHPAVIGLPRVGARLPQDFVFTDLVSRYYPDHALLAEPGPELAALDLQIFTPSAPKAK